MQQNEFPKGCFESIPQDFCLNAIIQKYTMQKIKMGMHIWNRSFLGQFAETAIGRYYCTNLDIEGHFLCQVKNVSVQSEWS